MVDELIWYIVIANFSSLKDAFDSGAFKWTLERKKEFAVDGKALRGACRVRPQPGHGSAGRHATHWCDI